ncbi:MAG: RNA methyltransferase [Burkholderiaceae bacterium]
MRVSSTDNPIYRRLKQFATSPRACREAQRTLIEGVHLLQAALAAKVPIRTLVLRGQEQSSEALDVSQVVSAKPGVKTLELAPALYDSISPVEHGAGALAEIEFATAPWPQRISADAIYLDNVQDPGNVGALLRTAAAAGVRHAITGPGCAAVWSPKVMRAAMGAHFVLEVHEQIEPEALRKAFDGEVLAADAPRGVDLFTTDWGRQPTLWLFGGEGQGLSADALALADQRLRISINPRIESLNVSAAAAVCLFEQQRRRSANALN